MRSVFSGTTAFFYMMGLASGAGRHRQRILDHANLSLVLGFVLHSQLESWLELNV